MGFKGFEKDKLIRLADEAMWYALRRVVRVEGVEWGREEGVTWILTPGRKDGCNNVFDLHLGSDTAPAEVDRLIDKFRSRGLDSFWWAGASSRPGDLPAMLGDRGFKEVEILTGMALSLDRFEDRADSPEGLEIRLVEDSGTLKEMLELFGPAADLTPLQARQTYESLLDPDGSPDPVYRHFVGLKDGRVVCSTSYFLENDRVDLDYVSTDPGYRRRGYARAVFSHALREARREGCRMALLQASKMGRPLYLSLGFEELSELSVWSDKRKEA